MKSCTASLAIIPNINFKLLMQEAPNSKEKDEQQERGNYDSANYMETKWTHKADKKRRH